MHTSLVTSNWQLYIPQAIRNTVGWEKPGSVEIFIDGKNIVLKPKNSPMASLSGILKNRVKKGSYIPNKERDLIDFSDDI